MKILTVFSLRTTLQPKKYVCVCGCVYCIQFLLQFHDLLTTSHEKKTSWSRFFLALYQKVRLDTFLAPSECYQWGGSGRKEKGKELKPCRVCGVNKASSTLKQIGFCRIVRCTFNCLLSTLDTDPFMVLSVHFPFGFVMCCVVSVVSNVLKTMKKSANGRKIQIKAFLHTEQNEKRKREKVKLEIIEN